MNPDTSQQLQNQIHELQEKLLFQDDSLQKLDNEVLAQYKLIETLQRQIKQQEQKIATLEQTLEDSLSGPASEANVKPPHY